MKELTIGKILLAHRRQQGITQDALAAWLGCQGLGVKVRPGYLKVKDTAPIPR